ncbi:nucleotide exchange factor GrpE [Pseudoprevotella muciniphila]|uniref:Protein GrpE n=1 Tax=Pseudoprevotella muciniphila TaxID=2133944 RepID=A0A5P8E4L3_9BACT|nr:nucleotide exchange factor GrpE [Pseudoprevotella muciniphila]QFQ11866.1 nucleotide exchange factor GrpE [Pseudoprevotella muciniphila]
MEEEQEERKEEHVFNEENEVTLEVPKTEGSNEETTENVSEEDTVVSETDKDLVESKETGEETHELTTEELLAKTERELTETNDKYLRQIAEFDNYRKRTLKEKADLILNGGEKVLTSLLPILDDFSRALENIEKSNDIEALKDGVKLISDKLFKCLAEQGLQKIETEGQDFNTDYHEAIAMIPAPSDEEKGKVMDCVQTGYKLNDKVIRHAKVAVGQ